LLTADSIISKYLISSYDDNSIQLSEKADDSKTSSKLLKHHIKSNCFVSYQDLIIDYPEKQFSDLSLESLKKFIDIEILLIGTGKIQYFPNKKLYTQLAQLEYSIDFMDTHAACRTFNILVNENRKVGALLFF
jgi:uncharacterized protein